MGTLYDIGNFRYRHFTFNSCADENGSSNCESSPINDDGTDEIIKFLDRVWPHKGIFIGDSSEGDYSFVTYVVQKEKELEVKNIYVYKRVREVDITSPTDQQVYNLVWKQVLDPVTSLKPGVIS